MDKNEMKHKFEFTFGLLTATFNFDSTQFNCARLTLHKWYSEDGAQLLSFKNVDLEVLEYGLTQLLILNTKVVGIHKSHNEVLERSPGFNFVRGKDNVITFKLFGRQDAVAPETLYLSLSAIEVAWLIHTVHCVKEDKFVNFAVPPEVSF